MCIDTDAVFTHFGRCGDDTPAASLPTSLDPLPAIDDGVVRDWETVCATWWRGLELMDVSLLVSAFQRPHCRAPTPSR